MIGFGSLARESGLTLAMAVVSTLGTWGLPGQVAFAELYAVGAPALVIILAGSMANARFFPMALTMLPHFRDTGRSNAWLYLIAHTTSLNPWAEAMRSAPGQPPLLRMPYFAGFTGICFTFGTAGTVIGYVMTGAMPEPVKLGLVFLNPLFFTLMFANTRGRMGIIALAFGAVTGPLLHLLSPDWGLLLTGALAGTAAYGAHVWSAKHVG